MVRFSPNEPLASVDTQPALPVVELLAGEGVHRLGVAAVASDVADEVVDQAAAQAAALGAGRPQGGDVDRTLADAGDPDPSWPLLGSATAEVDGGDASGHGSSLGAGPR